MLAAMSTRTEEAVAHIRKINEDEELEYLYELYGRNEPAKIFHALVNASNVLHNRSQLLLSLITICLTIAGFSGERVARSSLSSRLFIGAGLFFVLISALVLISGPLYLRWGTQRRGRTMEESLLWLVHQRNLRTRKYYLAAMFLILGLSGFVGSLINYLVTV